MSTDISVSSTTHYQAEKRSWLLSPHGTEYTPSITLDVSAFTQATHYPDGYIKSGIVLGKIAASGKYGPYSGTTDEVQSVTITGSPTGGTFTLTRSGQTTAAIAYNATAADVQEALEALSNIGVGDVAVSGAAGGPFTVKFQGALADTDVAAMTATASLTGGTTPGVTIATATAGGADASSDGRQVAAGLLFSSVKVNLLDLTKDVGGAMVVHGFCDAAKLPIAAGAAGGGSLDANARADLNLIRFEN